MEKQSFILIDLPEIKFVDNKEKEKPKVEKKKKGTPKDEFKPKSKEKREIERPKSERIKRKIECSEY